MNFFNNSNGGAPSRLASLRPNFMRSTSNKTAPPAAKQQATDNVPVLLYCAAQCLSNTIEEILSDTSNLVGDNLTGFQRLLDILNDESTSDDMVTLSSSGGRGCLQTMLDNMGHPKFIEICNQAALATALMHALRLIRMLEIKKCKLMATNPSEVEHISTLRTTERVSKVMKFLCTDLKTIEQIKQSIVKLLIFPLGVLPATALHIQDQSAAIVSTLCRTGFSSQQVWFLHDVQAITHMVRHLNELTVLESSNDVASPRRNSNSNSSKLSAQSPLALMAAAAGGEAGGDELLRGLSAEQKGMWIVGVQCLVEVIACTLSISSVLMSDFEAAGGGKLFIHMMKFSSPERFMVLINIVTQLMFDPEKTADEAMISTSAGSILIDFLREVLHLRQSIKLDQSVESLMLMAETIFKNRSSLVNKEYMIQSMSYSLLTIYSNNPQNCSALEETYNFLPTLILAIPSITLSDSISAVLTALNFVCLCVESCAGLPMTALCASCAIIIQQALRRINETDSEKAFSEEEETSVALQLDLVFQTVEGIMRNNARYAMVMLNSGFLHHAIYDPFVNLCTQVLLGAEVKTQSIPIFGKVVQILLSIIAKTSEAADEVRDSGLTLIIKNLVSSKPVSREFSQMLLRLTKTLARSDESHLKDSFNTIFTTIQAVESDFGKLRQLADTLAVILLENEESPALCYLMGGMEYTVGSLNSFFDKFSEFIVVYGVDYTQSAAVMELVHSLEAVMRVLSFQISLSSPHPTDAEFATKNLVFRKYYELIADSLFNSGIFSSAFTDRGLDFVFHLIAGFTGRIEIVNAGAVEILVKLMARFDSALFNVALVRFCEYAESSETASKLLNETGIVCQLIEYFHPIFHDVGVSYDHPIFKLFRLLTQTYLTVDSFVALFKYIVRPVVLPGESDFQLMLPWESFSAEQANASWRALQYLTDITLQSKDRVQNVPFIGLGTVHSVQKWTPAYLTTTFNSTTNLTFPANGFTYSCWYKWPEQTHASQQQAEVGEVIPVLSLSAGDCFFEAHIDLDRSFVRVASLAKNGAVSSLLFKPVLQLNPRDWTSLVIIVKKTKKLTTGSKVNVAVHINGINCEPETTDAVNIEPTVFSASIITMDVGRLALNMSRFAPDVHADDAKSMRILSVPMSWHLGPLYLFEEVLTPEQVVNIFMKGPKYTGSFTAESPLTDHPTSIACHLLYRCNATNKTADVCLDLLGLASLETITSDSHSERDCEWEFPAMLAPILALNATSIVLNREKKLPDIVTDADGNLSTELDSEGTITIDGDVCQQIPANRFLLTNTASLEVKHHASLENGYFHSSSVSVADCLAAIGGPETLFPLLQAASTESQICLALHMIHYSVRHNVANLRYMQNEGYKIVAFILSMKQSSILTESVIESLMQLAVDKNHRIDVRSSYESLFLVDTSAFYHLLLNHHVWEVRRFNTTFSIVSKMLALTVDERYSVQNAHRLSRLNVTRWVIMICAYSVSQLDPQPHAEYYEMNTTPPPSRGHDRKRSWTEKDLSDFKEDWLFQYPTANQMAEYRDTSDMFLQESMNLAKRVINIDIRKKDIDLLAKMVMYTFKPVKSSRKGQPSSRRSSPRPPSTPSVASTGVPKKRDWRMRTSSADITDNGTINLAELGEEGESVSSSCPFCNYNESKTYSYDGDDQPYENIFTPMCVFRVYLLRLLFSVYDNYLEELRWSTNQTPEGGPRKSIARNVDKDVFEYFRSACSPAWFLAVLEQNGQDIATKTHCLRLLGLFLQKDAQFLREFSACDGFKIMHTTLTVEAQEISVVLPLIAMLFRIPIQVLLHPFQIKSVDKFLQVLNLEECLGCDTQEPGLSDLTIPLLSLLFDCLTNACRAKDDPTKQFVPLMDLLLGVLRFAMSKMSSFKALIQRRAAVEILSIAVLSCSDGFNDFGTHIYRNSDDLISDLSYSVKEDYISTPPSTPPPSGKTAYDVPKTADVRLIQAADPSTHNLEIEMVGTEGEKMIDIVSMSLHFAVMELENVHTLIYYLISYPVGFLATYEYGFQKLIVNTFTNVVNNLTSKTFEPVLMLHITDLIANLIPLVRANILYDAVLFDVFKLTISLTRIAIDVPYSNSQDRVRSVIKEIGSTARFFSFACINKHFDRAMRNSVFAIIRENLDILFHPALEDIADVGLQAAGGMFPRRLGAENGVGTGNAAVLEAVQALGVGLGNAKKVSVWSMPYVKADRNRISQVFWVYMTNVCYGMVLEDDSAVRIDATRILAYLSVNRGTLMEQVLGNFTVINTVAPRMWKTNVVAESPQETAEKASKEVDIFRDGFSKLVPDAAGNYEIFRRGATDDNESEENRFADFSFWISDNNIKCDKIFFAIDSALQWLTPPAAELEEIRRQLEYVSANHTATGLTAIQSNAKGKDHIDAVKNALAATEKVRRTEAGARQGDQVVQLVGRFQTFGLSSLASGACAWGHAWHAAQSSPIWGYLPLKQLRRDRGQEDAPTVGSGDGFFGHVDRHNENEEQEFKKAWYLNFTEGPEGMRRKLEQDYSVPLPLHANQKKDTSRKAAILLDDRSSAISSPDKKQDESVDLSGGANEDMEDFLKKIAREGLIKRVDAEEEDFEGADDEDEAYLALQAERRSLAGGDAPARRRSSAAHAVESAEAGDTPAMLERDIVTSINELALGASGDKLDADPWGIELSLELGNDEDDEGEGNFGELSPVDQDESMTFSKRLLEDDISTEDCIESSKQRRSAMLTEIVKGIIGASEWAKGNVYNVRRIYALEAHSALLVITPNNMHFLCGFVAKKTQKSTRSNAPTAPTCVLEWMSPQQQKEHFDKVNTTNRPQSVAFAELHDTDWTEDIWKELLRNDLGYSRFPLSEIYSFFRRRHQLKYTAMEVTDVMGYSVLYSCESVVENEQILVTLLQSELPSSIFNRVIGIAQLQLLRSIGSNVNSNITSNVYNRLVSLFVNQVTALWQHGELSNFEYLMHINAAAGRSFQDLTQYPVFPWVIADYASETLDFDNPATFRDLTKPMGAIGPRREQQYRDRYQTMDEFFKDGIEGSSPPFFYGTHYSCAGYVLHYLLRVQPYADMSVALQGGTFDKADRLFLSVENSWISASQENLQDVRELIPEFYYLPEFLCNSNKFDLGSTQREAVVQDVVLPVWAHGDPQEYIRIQREALESKYVSQNLHHWIDLIFGFKQRGQAAIDSLNVFIHLTYEGEIDVDAITDPIMRTATISQINNFGQTPSRVFRKPHPQKIVPESLKRIGDGVVADPNALFWHAHLSPPLSVVGAPAHSILNKISFVGVTYFGNIRGLPVGDVRLLRDRLIAVPAGSALVGPHFKRAIRYGGVSGGITIQSIQNLVVGTRALDNEKENTDHEDLHQKPVSCLAVSKNGAYFATGSDDTSVRVWQITKLNNQRHVSHVCTLVGHAALVTCIDISTEFSMVVSGGADSVVCVWDFRLKRMLRLLGDHKGPVISVSMNAMSGFIATLTVQQLRLYTVNGELVSYVSPANPLGFRLNGTDTLSPPCVVLAAPCGAWQDGVVLVTGHKDGYLYLWKLSKPVLDGADEAAKKAKPVTTESLLERKVQPYVTTHNRAKFRELYIAAVPVKIHKANITVLKLSSTVPSKGKDSVAKTVEESRALELLVGDADGFVSRWAPLKLDTLASSDLMQVLSSSQLDGHAKR